ncbi:MAG: glucosamine-6-phosphate deaminase [Treponema sp.]|jgi:glucosamine-6-phosphate deaminase|nr:glucosamine-6-phosphate deaminase [Treponema sp.]
MRLIICRNYEQASAWSAQYIANRIMKQKEKCVLGLPTGSSPLGIYKELIALHRAHVLSFSHVITFNMDEYVGLSPDHPQSYHRFMWDNFFNFIDIKKEHVHILNGCASDLEKECAEYEACIAATGGIDLFLGGMGVDGHIAFNEPGSSLTSHTRIKSLTTDTKYANARFFGGDIHAVPSTALTVGVATIMAAREVLIIVSGHSKARALQATVEGPVSQMCTLSCLQMHAKVIIVCDEEATDELKVSTVRYFKDIESKNISAS